MRYGRSSPLPAAVLLIFSVAGCGGSGSPLSPGGPPERAGGAPTFAHGHLYVGVSGFYSPSTIYRFPLDANGLPSNRPDGELTLSAQNPGSIAIGPGGDLYVSSVGVPSGCNFRKCYVEVFAPGASGRAKPIRVLYVPQRPYWIAVDQQGYLDAMTLNSGGNVTNVYAPNAKGHDQPINHITTPGVNSLGASRGIAYVQTLQLGTGIEAVEEHAKSKGPVFYSYGYNYSANGVAIEGTHLFAQFFWRQGYYYFLATAVWRIGTPGRQIRTIVGTGCKTSLNGGALGYGLAAYKKYIYEGCIEHGGNGGIVLVYDSTGKGKEKPLLTLTGGDAGVAIGP